MYQDGDITGLYRRDGHLTELSLFRFMRGELSAEERAEVEAHIDACEVCAERLAELRSFESDFRAGPLASPAWLAELEEKQAAPKVVSLAERRRSKMPVYAAGTLFAAAAALFLMLSLEPEPSPEAELLGVGQEEPDDGIRLKGRAFSMQVHANDGAQTRTLAPGGVVHPGERLGFSVYPRKAGHLMIVGVDERNEAYLCYPQAKGTSASIEAQKGGLALEEAVRLDSVLGTERLVAFFCDEGFDFEDIKPRLESASGRLDSDPLPQLKEGCWQEEVVLEKRASD